MSLSVISLQELRHGHRAEITNGRGEVGGVDLSLKGSSPCGRSGLVGEALGHRWRAFAPDLCLPTGTPLADRSHNNPVTAVTATDSGRRGREPLLMRWGFKRAGGLKWERDVRRTWMPAELTEPFAHIARRAELSADVTAYALRHSSIVRGLRAGLPVRLVAALHDTSSEMIEAHYSSHIIDALSDAARLAVVPLTETGQIAKPRTAC